MAAYQPHGANLQFELILLFHSSECEVLEGSLIESKNLFMTSCDSQLLIAPCCLSFLVYYLFLHAPLEFLFECICTVSVLQSRKFVPMLYISFLSLIDPSLLVWWARIRHVKAIVESERPSQDNSNSARRNVLWKGALISLLSNTVLKLLSNTLTLKHSINCIRSRQTLWTSLLNHKLCWLTSMLFRSQSLGTHSRPPVSLWVINSKNLLHDRPAQVFWSQQQSL